MSNYILIYNHLGTDDPFDDFLAFAQGQITRKYNTAVLWIQRGWFYE